MAHGARVLGLLTALGLVAVACSPELDWRELRSEEGRFVALLPGKSRLEERELSGSRGAVMHMWTARAGSAVYGVGYRDAPDADPGLVVRTRDALVANIGGRLIADKEVFEGPLRGREFRAEGANAALVARVLAGDGRLYQLAVVGKAPDIDATGVETFFSSFRVR